MAEYFSWRQSHMGGGGYITGFTQDPNAPDIIYARCDVGGVFKSLDRGCSWQSMNHGMTLCHHHSVRSLATNPFHPEILIRCSGEARGHQLFGDIHRSTDGGQSWRAVCNQVDFYGNGPTRYFGEVAAFDPFDETFATVGGYSAGIWISRDAGEHWDYAALRNERIIRVCFHPFVRGQIIAATISDAEVVEGDAGLERLHDLPRGTPSCLYRSCDLGTSWEVLCEGLTFSELAFDPDQPQVLYGATQRHGVVKSMDGGHTWQAKMRGLPGNIAYNTITACPGRPLVLYTAPDARPEHEWLPPIPIYRSSDQGESWQLVKQHTEEDLKNYPAYMTIRYAGWAPSHLAVDGSNPQRLYLANWFGLAESTDGGLTWDAHQFQGLETICGENILCDPSAEKTIYSVLADHAPFVSRDNGQTYQMFRSHGISSSALAASRHRRDWIVMGLLRRDNNPCTYLACSPDGGQTVEMMLELPKELFIQALAEDPFTPGKFWAFVDGPREAGAGLYRSKDWGKSWHNLQIELPAYIRTLPHQKDWIEAELLSVVVYQVKNACGANQLLCADPHRPGVVYLGEWTEGLFAIQEDKRSIHRIDQGLPFGRDRASVLSVIRADPERPGYLYAGFIREGLWRSTDHGGQWEKLYPQNGQAFNASSLAIGGPDGRELAVASEPLYWSPSPSAVLFSPDLGQTWQDISDDRLGAIRWKGIALEKNSGFIHGISCGNGCFVAERHPVE